jgi:carbamoyl-phosphate synthase large subunit
MKSTGEAMAIDRCFEAALQKAVRSLEMRNRDLLWEDPTWTRADLERLIREPNDLRLWALMAALRRGLAIETLAEWSGIDPFFLHKLQSICTCEQQLLAAAELSPALARRAKRLGFSDSQMGTLLDEMPERIRGGAAGHRPTTRWSIPAPRVKPSRRTSTVRTSPRTSARFGAKVVVLGSGPIRIGQGIEFDYCSVRAAIALRDQDVHSIMINSNPETVSTDFDASTRLYFEPLDEESVRDVLENETSADGYAQLVERAQGMLTAINLAEPLVHAGYMLWAPTCALSTWPKTAPVRRPARSPGHPQPAGGIVNRQRSGRPGRSPAIRCWSDRRSCSADARWRSVADPLS